MNAYVNANICFCYWEESFSGLTAERSSCHKIPPYFSTAKNDVPVCLLIYFPPTVQKHAG